MRFVFVWGLALILASCGKEPAPAPAPASEPAGKVLAVEGEVTARRAAEGSAARALAVDAPVWADDTVVAPAGASLQVLLAHNGVTWSFAGGPEGATRRVDASVAWRAAKGSGAAEALAKAEGDRTASAGRHTEGEAAGTAASVEEKKAEAPAPAAEPEPKPDRVVREEAAPPTTKAAAKPKRAAPAKPEPSAADEAAPPPPPPAPIAAPSAPAPAQPAPPAPAPAEKEKDSGGLGEFSHGAGAGSGGPGLGGAKTAAPQPEVKLTVVDSGPGLDRAVVQRTLRRSFQRMRSCVDKAYAADPTLRGAATVLLTIELSGAARLGKIEVAPRNVELATCLDGALSVASFPAPTARVPVTFRLDYAPAP